MAKPRLYCTEDLVLGTSLRLSKEVSRHAHQVLRLSTDDPLTLFDGKGGEYEAIITAPGKQIEVHITEHNPVNRESSLGMHLIQGISRGERMDYVVQKATELGVSRISPVFTRRTVVKLDERRQLKRLQHWQGVAQSACEQSGRTILPLIDPPSTLSSALTLAPESLSLLLDTQVDTALDRTHTPETVRLLIGPEGGLTPEELVQARSAGFQGVKFGPRIMRTETAPVAALGIIGHLWGDL